jgi:DNA-binding HxlR family transcriptional regulator
MKRTSFEDMNCSLARALEIVGEWWTLLVLREAFLGARRFEELQDRLGIARNVLTARLKALAKHGVLERRRYQERPARHEYVLTEKGRALYPVIVTLLAWGDRR